MAMKLEDRDDVIEVQSSYILVEGEDGVPEFIPRSKQNELIYNHGLDGLLIRGDSILSTEHNGVSVKLIPDEDAREYTLNIDGKQITIPPHRKSDLVDIIHESYEDEGKLVPSRLKPLVQDIVETAVNPTVVNPATELLTFDVDTRDDGWLINDSVLLTFDNEVYRPDRDTYSRDGRSVVQEENEAYDLDIDVYQRHIDQMTLHDFVAGKYSTADLRFLSIALWLGTYEPTPDDLPDHATE